MEKYMKDFNGEQVFCLEYDKSTLVDMVNDLQEKYNSILTDYRMSIEKRVNLEQRIDKAIKYIKKYRDDRDGELYLLMSETDDLLEILKGENNE